MKSILFYTFTILQYILREATNYPVIEQFFNFHHPLHFEEYVMNSEPELHQKQITMVSSVICVSFICERSRVNGLGLSVDSFTRCTEVLFS